MDGRSSSEDGWRDFIELCCGMNKRQELEELFDLFFTIEEREALAKRYQIIKALVEEKMPQREIAEKMGVSISKITRGSNALKIISKRLREALKLKMA
jgi:TrpR family trp operon transcriptional repressor